MNDLSEETIAEYRESFKQFDKDGDGAVTVEELGEVMKCLGHQATDQELKDIIREVDKDNSGTMDFQEFVAMMEKRQNPKDEDDAMRETFAVFDSDGDGHITVTELRKAMENLGEMLSLEEVTEMVREADLDGDNKINYEEFVRMMTSSSSSKDKDKA